jgi:prophage maintenance system killer protein
MRAGALTRAFAIDRNHPFSAGNKSTALVMVRTFPILNGRNLMAPQEEKYTGFLVLAAWIGSRLRSNN